MSFHFLDEVLASPDAALNGSTSMKRLNLRVSKRWHETENILGLELRAPDGSDLPVFDAGAHLNLFLPNGLVRQYSLVNNPAERDRYVLGILLDMKGRGGSQWVHSNLKAGDPIEVSRPLNNFPLLKGAEKYLLIAGGIGITPILSMIEQLRDQDSMFQLYYCTRSVEETAFRKQLSEHGNVTFVHDGGDPDKGLDLPDLLARCDRETHIYCCGPSGLMKGVRDATSHWPDDLVHFEWFAGGADRQRAPEQAQPFTVMVASTGQELHVPADKSLLQVLTENGYEVESVCQEGICGSCSVNVLDGEIEHNDVVLDEHEKAANDCMMTCCSRARSSRLMLDL